MADSRDDIQAALDEAKRARDEADRIRREARAEADRLRDEARRSRDEARRLRDQAREQSRTARRGPPGGFQPGPRGPHGPGFHFGFQEDPGTPGSRTEQAFSLEGIDSVHIDQTAGKLTIRTCAEGETSGLVSTGNKTAPDVIVTRDGSRLTLEVKLPKGWLFRRRQGASTVIRLDEKPYHQLRIENGAGQTEVQGLVAEDLRINVGAGSVQCILNRGSLDVNVGAGKVAVLSHAGLARCDSGTGDVLLDIAELGVGEYKVDVGIGRAEVRFPPDGQVHIKTSSGIGKTRIEYPSAPESAPARLRLNSGIGECIVKSREPGATGAAQSAAAAAQAKPQRSSRSATASRRREGEEMRVLQMLEQGKITPQDAADLIAALQGSTAPQYDEGDDENADGGVFRS